MNSNILLVGVGRMGQEYAKVLNAMNKPFVPVGRGEETALTFKEKTGMTAITGGVKKYLSKGTNIPNTAIITVNVPDLFLTCRLMLNSGIKRILLEKPGALTLMEITELKDLTGEKNAEVFIGYNRRFFESVREAKRMLTEDGGVLSFQFEFTEWSDKVEVFDADLLEKEKWFLSNSSHVADLAFFLGGKPVEIKSFTSGSLKWHKSAAAFCGSGNTDKGSVFSYSANWDAPGRWGVELMSRNFRIILRPMEQLQIQKRGEISIEPIIIDDSLDKKFKPGLYRMVDSFLKSEYDGLCSIDEQADIFGYYCQIANYR